MPPHAPGCRTVALELAPAAGPVVRDDLLEHRQEGTLVDRIALAEGDGASRLVVVAGGDDALGVGHDGPVVEEDVDVVLGGEERADVAIEDEVGLDAALDRLLDSRVRRMDEIPDLAEDLPLPRGQVVEVGVDPRDPSRTASGHAPVRGSWARSAHVEDGSPRPYSRPGS